MKYVFEVSWEVCNKVGGINTVIATKAPESVANYGDGYIALGPDLGSLLPLSAALPHRGPRQVRSQRAGQEAGRRRCQGEGRG